MNKIHLSPEGDTEKVDVLVVGGGINGAGIAAAASERGLKVLLCEQHDLASATSSASSKLIHGGLRYLEHYEFRLVKEALAEREILLRKVPHLVWPLEFILPHSPQLRPKLLIRAGLFLYDHLSTRSRIPASKAVSLKEDGITQARFTKGFSYYDCSVDDSRLVIANALAVKRQGGEVVTHTKCITAKAESDYWSVALKNNNTDSLYTVQAKALVNASGPWAESFIRTQLKLKSPRSIRLVKGSHIIVPRLYLQDHAYILQNSDQRIVFVIPYLKKFSLIGTTDEPYEGDPMQAKISDQEVRYLLKCVNDYFHKTVKKSEIVSHYAGIRPLCDDECSNNPSAMSRDYTLEIQEVNSRPLLTVFGGKITTYRKSARAAIEKLSPYFPTINPCLTVDRPLPGGDFQQSNWSKLLSDLSNQAPWLSPEVIERMARNYGSECTRLLESAKTQEEMGQHFGCGLYQIEVDYLVANEWAQSLEDIIWRRNKLGYLMSELEQKQLANYLAGC